MSNKKIVQECRHGDYSIGEGYYKPHEMFNDEPADNDDSYREDDILEEGAENDWEVEVKIELGNE